jgi:hypothetical protein
VKNSIDVKIARTDGPFEAFAANEFPATSEAPETPETPETDEIPCRSCRRLRSFDFVF